MSHSRDSSRARGRNRGPKGSPRQKYETAESLLAARGHGEVKVYYAQPVYGDEEIEAVVRALGNSLLLVHGPSVARMEQEVAELFAKRSGIMVNSGSSANMLAVALLDLPPGSEVITPALTFSTTVAPLVQQGLVPAFVDVEMDTFNVDAGKVERMITPATRAMMIPDLLGNLPDWPTLRELADRHGLMVIQDSADTIGSRYDGGPSGRFADISTTSFYATHVLTCGGVGGMLCVDDEDMEVRARVLRAWGRSSARTRESEHAASRFQFKLDGIPYDTKFAFEAVGFNFLPSEAAAAFGLVQLSKLADFVARRKRNFQALYSLFQNLEEWFILPRQRDATETNWLAFPFLVRREAPFTRRDIQVYLESAGIQTRVIFTGNILRQPGFAAIAHCADPEGYPAADFVMRSGLLVGCHHGMTEDQLAYVCDTVGAFARQYSAAP